MQSSERDDADQRTLWFAASLQTETGSDLARRSCARSVALRRYCVSNIKEHQKSRPSHTD